MLNTEYSLKVKFSLFLDQLDPNVVLVDLDNEFDSLYNEYESTVEDIEDESFEEWLSVYYCGFAEHVTFLAILQSFRDTNYIDKITEEEVDELEEIFNEYLEEIR